MSRFLLATLVVIALAGFVPAGACDRPLARGVARLVKAEVRVATAPGRFLFRRPACECPNCPAAQPKAPIVVPEIMPARPKPKPKVVGQDAPQSFEAALREQIAARPDHAHTKHVLKILNMEPGAKRDRVLERMERHVATHLEIGDVAKFDWKSINWEMFFETIIKFVLAIAPFLGL